MSDLTRGRVPTGDCSRELHLRVETVGPIPELVIVSARQSPADFGAGFVETTEPLRIQLHYVERLCEVLQETAKAAAAFDLFAPATAPERGQP